MVEENFSNFNERRRLYVCVLFLVNLFSIKLESLSRKVKYFLRIIRKDLTVGGVVKLFSFAAA